jgi:hypothetical protein
MGDAIKAILQFIVPAGVGALGAMLLPLAFVLAVFDVQGKSKIPWDRVGAWSALIGGFGVGGAAAGWLGQGLSTTSTQAKAQGSAVLISAVGFASVGTIILVATLWVMTRTRSKGIGAKTRTRSIIVVLALAFCGAVYGQIDALYGAADSVLGWAHGLLPA